MKNVSQQYDKVQNFIKQQYEDITTKQLIVKNHMGNLQVGKFHISPTENLWQVTDKNGNVITELRQKRLAVLAAAFITLKKHKIIRAIQGIDQKYDIFVKDQHHYKHLFRMNPDKRVYEDRLARADGELDNLKNQIHELEKTANLL
jgi:hypothetical protein